MMPFQILSVWLRGLLSIALIVLAVYLFHEWYEQSHVFVPTPTTQPTTMPSSSGEWMFHYEPGANRQTALLAGAIATVLVSLGGGRLLMPLLLRRGTDDPKLTRGGTVRRLRRADGGELQVETYGDAQGVPVVLTHGLGTDGRSWYYAKRELAGCKLTVWDMPGSGLSTRRTDNDYALSKLAADLRTVVADAVEQAGGKPVILVGHSMGGMIQLEYCKLFPEDAGRLVAGIAEIHTTYTNPLKTMKNPGLHCALQKPLIEPLLYLTIALSPLVWLMNVLSYLNGSAHSSQKRSGFGGKPTYGQVDFVTRFTLSSSPAVLARCMFGMLRWDASSTLPTIRVPALLVPGDRDATCTPEASDRMKADIPAADLRPLSPAKHFGFVEHHADFAALVLSFVQG